MQDISTREAEAHLARSHPVFARLVEKIGPCTLQSDPRLFGVLVRSVVYQLISVQAARTIVGRLEAVLPLADWTPEGFRAVTDERLRGCGLSGGKVRTVRALSEHAHTQPAALAGLHAATDAEAVKRLTAVHGVGPWTAQMFLIFGLGRTDVLPVGDLGLRQRTQEQFRLTAPPNPAELEVMAGPWRPWRTVATWYLWKSRGFVPQSA
jgi:DNA-3-methyladenine glycosylase II